MLVDLPDRRQVAYETYGDDEGEPAVLLHGFSDSRLTGGAFDAAARDLGVRLVVPDRPGHGLSTGRLVSFEDAARWTTTFAGVLGLGRFPLLAVSGGAPFALATARFAPQRLERVIVVSGLGPPELGTAGMRAGQRAAIAAASRAPAAAAGVLAGIARLATISPALFLWMVGSASSSTDARAAKEPSSAATMARPFVEAYHQGPGGVAAELRLVLRPWSFQPEDVDVAVHFEHGADDATVPPSVPRVLAARIPGATTSIRAGVGHFTLVPSYATEILQAVV